MLGSEASPLTCTVVTLPAPQSTSTLIPDTELNGVIPLF